MASDDAIQIRGLAEFKAVVKAMDVNTPKQMKNALNGVAKIVVVGARVRAPVRSGRLRGSIRAASTPTRAQIRMGSGTVLYAGFIDYGGTVGLRRHTAEFRAARKAGRARFVAVRPYIPTGRIMYPAFMQQRTLIQAELRKALIAVATTSGAAITHGS